MKEPHVLVIGAGGIGEGVAVEYARRGARLALFARRPERLQEVAAIARDAGAAEVRVLPGDATKPAEVAAAVAELIEAWPAIDRLWFCAGSGGDPDEECCSGKGASVAAFSARSAEAMMRVNYLGLLYFLEPVLAVMRAQRSGAIAVTGSLAADRGMPRSGPYAASKAALRALVDGLRVDARQHGIHVCLIEGGFVESDLTRRVTFRMPYLKTREEAAVRFVRGVEGGEAVIRYPWQMSVLSGLGARVPRPLFDRWAAWKLRREYRD